MVKLYPKTKLKTCIIFIAFILFSSVMSLILGQDNNWDHQNYHLYNGFSFIEGRLDYDIFPVGMQTYLNPILDIPLYLLSKYFNSYPNIIRVIQGVPWGIIGFLLFLIIDEVYDKKLKFRWISVIFALVIGMTGFSSVSQIATSFNEIQNSVFVMLSLLLILKGLSANARQSLYFILSGVLMGGAVGLKLTAMIYFISLGLSIFLIAPFRIKSSFQYLIGSFLGLVITSGFWIGKMFFLFGNPIYPFYNGFFKSPSFPPLNFVDSRFLPKTFVEGILYPFLFGKNGSLVAEIGFTDFRIALVYGLTILTIFYGIYRLMRGEKLRIEGVYELKFYLIFCFFVISLIVWISTFSIIRYAVPIEALSGILIISLLIFNLGLNTRFLWVSSAILIFLLTTTTINSWGRIKVSEKYITHDAPDLSREKIILINGFPNGFLIPYLKSEARYIIIDDGLVEKTQDEIIELINLNHGKISVLSVTPTLDIEKNKFLKAAFMSNDNLKCRTLTTNFGNRYLCSTPEIVNSW